MKYRVPIQHSEGGTEAGRSDTRREEKNGQYFNGCKKKIRTIQGKRTGEKEENAKGGRGRQVILLLRERRPTEKEISAVAGGKQGNAK